MSPLRDCPYDPDRPTSPRQARKDTPRADRPESSSAVSGVESRSDRRLRPGSGRRSSDSLNHLLINDLATAMPFRRLRSWPSSTGSPSSFSPDVAGRSRRSSGGPALASPRLPPSSAWQGHHMLPNKDADSGEILEESLAIHHVMRTECSRLGHAAHRFFLPLAVCPGPVDFSFSPSGRSRSRSWWQR